MDRNDDPPRPAQSGAARRQALVASFGARALEEGLGLDALLAEAASHAAEGLRVKRAKVLQHRPEADDLLVCAGVGWRPGVVGHATLPTGLASPPGRALRTGAAVALEDVRVAEGFEWSGLLREHGVVSLLTVPVRVPGRAVWGVLEADAEAPRRFGPEHGHFLLSLAGLLGAAIRRLGVEAELRAAGARAEALAAERAAVLGQLAEGVIVTDRAGRITFVNDAAARIHGGAVLGVPPEGYSAAYRLLTEDGRPHPPEELPLARAVLRGETVTEARWRIRRPDGSEVLAAGSARPVLAPDGTRTGAVLTLRDETARDAAQRALRESEARFRGVFDQQFQFMAVLSPEGITLEINELPLRAAGTTRGEVIGRPFWETPFWAGLPAMREAWPGRLAEAARAEGPVLSEDLYEAAGGEVHTADAAVTAVRGPDGGVRFFVIQATDTTERRRAEAALRASEALKGAILASALDCVVTIDRESRVVEWNPAAERTFGPAREAALGRDMAELIVPPELREAHRRGLARYLATGEGPVLGRRIEVEALRADGSRFPAELAITPTSADGRTLFTAYLRDITERKAAEATIAEGETRFRAVADNIPQLAWMAEPDGRRRWYNRRWYDYTGQTPEEAEGWGWRGVHHPDHLDRVTEGMRRAWEAGEPWEDTFPLRGRDGRYRWFLTRAVPVREAEGGGALWFGTNTEVTAQREAEAALRESEARFRNMADSAPALIWTTDAEGRVAFANMHHDHLFGRPAAEMLGDGWRRVVHADDVDAFSARFLEAFHARRPFRAEVRVRDRNRAIRWLRCEGVPRLSDAGAFLGYTGCNVDVTEAKRAEAALRGLNATLEARVAERTRERNRVWELSRDLLAVVGLDGRLKAVNPAWSELLGRDEAALLAAHFSELVHPDDHGAVAGIAAALRRGEIVRGFEDRLRRADGTYVAVSWTAVPEGEVFYAVGRDVTREREREEQLRQAQKMEALGQLTGGIAHDFNNLLQGIVGALHMVQSRAAAGRAEDLGRYAEAALASAGRAAALTHRLLAFARRQPLDPRPTDANRLVASLEDLVRRTAGPAIEVETVLAGGLWPALCDPHQLENALLNLCINARDAMPDGGRLTVETANAHLDDAYAAALRDVSPGQYVAVCVTDTGAGMAPDVLARAFDPFFTTKPLGQGTGLGLSMVHGFARQSGGHVRIYSEEGRGTTVKLYLPRHRGQVPAEAEERGRMPSPAPSAGAAGATVLVVEDEPMVRALTVEVLEGMGCATLEAADGPSALRALRAAPRVDLLVTDVGLPGGLNGRQLADAARGVRPGLRVLFMTGYAENAAFGNGVLEPGMRIMTKPFALDALAAKVRAMIDGA
jgi:PAS domain S-box-containing protein